MGARGPGDRAGACCPPFPALCSWRPSGAGIAGSARFPRPPQSGRVSAGLGARPGGSGPRRRGHLRWNPARRRVARGGAAGTSRRVPGAGRGSGRGLRAGAGTRGRDRRGPSFCVEVLWCGGVLRAPGQGGGVAGVRAGTPRSAVAGQSRGPPGGAEGVQGVWVPAPCSSELDLSCGPGQFVRGGAASSSEVCTYTFGLCLVNTSFVSYFTDAWVFFVIEIKV